LTNLSPLNTFCRQYVRVGAAADSACGLHGHDAPRNGTDAN
jgi:hypothetical protein